MESSSTFTIHKVFNSSHFARKPLCCLLFRPFSILSSPTPIGSVFQGMLKGFVRGVFWWCFFAFGDLFFAPLFIFCACTASVFIGVASATLILCAPLFFLPFHERSRELFCFLRPFLFFVLAQQAIFGFGGGLVVVFLFFFAPLLRFYPFHGSAVNCFSFTPFFFAASAKRSRFCFLRPPFPRIFGGKQFHYPASWRGKMRPFFYLFHPQSGTILLFAPLYFFFLFTGGAVNCLFLRPFYVFHACTASVFCFWWCFSPLAILFLRPFSLRLHSKRAFIFSGGFGVIFFLFLRPFIFSSFSRLAVNCFIFAPLSSFCFFGF
jgi:hypothetical protein